MEPIQPQNPETPDASKEAPLLLPPPPAFTVVVPPKPPRRKLFALLVLAVATVGVLAGFKIARRAAVTDTFGIKEPKTAPEAPLATDPSFYQGEILKPPAKPKPVAAVAPKPVVPTDDVSASAYLVGNVATGQIYAERNGTTPLPIASMSKLMTAIVATDTITPTTTITITPEEASVYPDLSHIGAGESFSEEEMLYPLLLDSSNIAAEALASSTDRAKFLNLMNSYAWEIGLPKSFFADPSGLSPLNEASAEGFFSLAQYVYKSRPDLLAITRTVSVAVATTSEHGAHDFMSIHPFVTDPRFIGGKTGHTDEAADTMLTILNIDEQPIAFIVLHSNDRARDTTLLADQVSKTLAARQ